MKHNHSLEASKKKEYERLIQQRYDDRLESAVISDDLSTYKRIVEQIHADRSVDHNTAEYDAVRDVVYNATINSSGMTALHVAARYNSPKIAQFLISQPNVDINCVIKGMYAERSGWTALHFVGRYGSAKVARVLFSDKERRFLSQVNDRRNAGCTTPLHLACANWYSGNESYGAVIELLFDNGADLELTNDESMRADQVLPKIGQNPLAQGIYQPKPRVNIKDLIDREDYEGFYAYTREHTLWWKEEIDGFSILHYAAQNCSVDFFSELASVYGKATRAYDFVRALKSADKNGYQSIHWAARAGRADIVQYLLGQGVTPDELGKHDETPLHVAANHGSRDVCDLLIDRGANLAAVTSNKKLRPDQLGQTSNNRVAALRDNFFYALRNGNVENIKQFLEQNPNWVLVSDSTKMPLEVAVAARKFTQFANAYDGLIQRYQSPLNIAGLLNARNPRSMNPTSLVGQWVNRGSDKTDELVWMLKNGAELNGEQDSEKHTLLHLCVYLKNYAVLEALVNGGLDNRIDIHARTMRGETALDLAAKTGDCKALSILVEAGAAAKGVYSALSAVLPSLIPTREKIETISLLLEHNEPPMSEQQVGELLRLAIRHELSEKTLATLLKLPNANIEWRDSNGDNLIFYAVKNASDSVGLVDFLVGQNADPKATDSEGNTLLHIAATRSLAMVDCLTQYGLTFDVTNNSGVRPDQMSGSRKNVIKDNLRRIADYAKESGPRPSVLNKQWLRFNYGDTTFLHYAAAYGNVEVLQDFSEILDDDWGEAVNCRQEDGKRTPLASAVRSGQSNTTSFLLQNGADPSAKCVVHDRYTDYECSPFQYCVAMGNEKLVRLFLISGVKINLQERFSFGPVANVTILDATYHGDHSIDLIEMLVKAGADVSDTKWIDGTPIPFRKTSEGRRPLWDRYQQFLQLIKKGEARPVLDFLSVWNPTWLKIQDPQTLQNVVHLIAQMKNSQSYDFLENLFKAHQEIITPLLSQPDSEGQTPLHLAVASGNGFAVEWLLAHGVDKDAQDAQGNTPYHLAVKSQNSPIMTQLEKAGVDYNIKNNQRKTAKEVSVGFFSTNPIKKRESRFEEAICDGDLSTLMSLMPSNPELLHDRPEDILTMAATAGRYRVYKYLAELHIAKVNDNALVKKTINLSDGKFSLVHHIAKSRAWYCFDWYHQHGANFSLRPESSDTYPIWSAAQQGDVDAVKKLIAVNVEVSVGGGGTYTPLMASAMRGHDACTELLLQAGADTATEVSVYDEWSECYRIYRADDNDEKGYLRSKAQFIFDIVTNADAIHSDVFLLQDACDIKPLATFDELAIGHLEAFKLPRGKAQPRSLSKIFTDRDYKKVMAMPYRDLKAMAKESKENHHQFEKARAALVHDVLAKPFAVFNKTCAEGTISWRELREGVVALREQVDYERGRSLGEQHDNRVMPLIRLIVGKKGLPPVNTVKFDYTGVTANTVTRIQLEIDSFPRRYAKVVKNYFKARNEIFAEQKQAYGLLQDSIEEFQRLMSVLPSTVLDASGFFSDSLTTKAKPCAEALLQLKALAVEELPEAPTVALLASHKEPLQTLQDQLAGIVILLQQAETGHNAATQKQAEKERVAKEKAEQREAALARKEAASVAQSELKVINGLLKPVGSALSSNKSSPVLAFLATSNESVLSDKRYYTSELKEAIQAATKDYLAVCMFFGAAYDPLMPALSTSSSTASKLAVEKVVEFKEATAKLKKSVGVLSRQLEITFRAEAEDKQQQDLEAQLRLKLTRSIDQINEVSGAVSVALKSGSIEASILSAVNQFRESVNCGNKSLEPVIPNAELIATADASQLSGFLKSADYVQRQLDWYHTELDRENAEKQQKLHREDKLRDQINAQALEISKVLVRVRHNLKELPGEHPVPELLQTYRAAVGCTQVGVADIAPSAVTLGPLEERALQDVFSAGQKAQRAVNEYDRAVRRARSEHDKQLSKEDSLREKLKQQISQLNKTLGQIRNLFDEEDVADEEVLQAVLALRQQVGCEKTDLEDIVPSGEMLSSMNERALEKPFAQLSQTGEAVTRYHSHVASEKKAAREKAGREDQLRQQIDKAITGLNESLQTLLALQGGDPHEFSCLEALPSIRKQVGCRSNALHLIVPDVTVLNDINESDLNALLREIVALQKQQIAFDDKALRQRNQSSLFSITGHELNLLNRELKALGNASDRNTLSLTVIDRDSKYLHQTLAELVARVDSHKRSDEFSDITVSADKAELIPTSEHAAIVEEIQRLTAAVKAQKESYNEKAMQQRQLEREKSDALQELSLAVADLNDLVAQVNKTLTVSGQLMPSVATDMDLYRDNFEKPSSGPVSWFSSKAKSSTNQLVPVSFDNTYCDEKYGTKELSGHAEIVRAFIETLKEAHAGIMEVQQLQAGLVELRKQIDEAVLQLPEIETQTVSAFLNITLIPDSEKPRSAAQIGQLEETQRLGGQHLETLQRKIQEQQEKHAAEEREKQQQRQAIAKKIRGGLEKLNEQLAKLRDAVGSADADYITKAALLPTRMFFGQGEVKPLDNLEIPEAFFERDYPLETIIEWLETKTQVAIEKTLAEEVQGQIKVLKEELNTHAKAVLAAFKETPALKDEFEDRYQQTVESAKRALTAKEIPTIQGVVYDLEGLAQDVAKAQAVIKQQEDKQQEERSSKSTSRSKKSKHDKKEHRSTSSSSSRRKSSRDKVLEKKTATPATQQTEYHSDTETKRRHQSQPVVTVVPQEGYHSDTESTKRRQKSPVIETRSNSAGSSKTSAPRVVMSSTTVSTKESSSDLSTLQSVYKELHGPLLSKLKKQTGETDPRRTTFQQHHSAVYSSKGQDVDLLRAAIKAFKEIDQSFESQVLTTAPRTPPTMPVIPEDQVVENTPTTFKSRIVDDHDDTSPLSVRSRSSSKSSTTSSTHSIVSPFQTDDEKGSGSESERGRKEKKRKKEKRHRQHSSSPEREKEREKPQRDDRHSGQSQKEKEAARIKQATKHNEELKKLLQDFKSNVLDVIRYPLGYHVSQWNRNFGGLTPQEYYHQKYILEYCDGINEIIKEEIARIDRLPPGKEELDFYRCIRFIKGVMREIERILPALIKGNEVCYPTTTLLSNGQSKYLVEDRKQPNLLESELGMWGRYKRSSFGSQSEPHKNSCVGLYLDMPSLLAAIQSHLSLPSQLISSTMDHIKQQREAPYPKTDTRGVHIRRGSSTSSTPRRSVSTSSSALFVAKTSTTPTFDWEAHRKQHEAQVELEKQRETECIEEVKSIVTQINQLLKEIRGYNVDDWLRSPGGFNLASAYKQLDVFRPLVGCKLTDTNKDIVAVESVIQGNAFQARATGRKVLQAVTQYRDAAKEQKVRVDTLMEAATRRGNAIKGNRPWTPNLDFAAEQRAREERRNRDLGITVPDNLPEFNSGEAFDF